MGASKPLFMGKCKPPGHEKGLAGEGKTLKGVLKSWAEPRTRIKRV
jgi:hypothetical protein